MFDPLLLLRSQTHKLHLQLEQQPLLLRLLTQDVQVSEVVAVLQLHYWLYSRLEPLILQAIPDAYSPAFHLIEADLQWYTRSPVVECPLVLPTSMSAAELWGVRYVLEGSRLGGRLIHRHLLLQQQFDSQFFGRGITAPDWAETKQRLAQALAEPLDCQAASQAAKQTFTWFIEGSCYWAQ